MEAEREPINAFGVMRPSTPRESGAWLALCAALLALGVYILWNFLHALAWALVLAIALWPSYDRVQRRASSRIGRETVALLFTALVGVAILLPIATLAVDAVREFEEIIDYARSTEATGAPVPAFVEKLPYFGGWAADRWREHLSHAGWMRELAEQLNASSLRQLWTHVGANALHRLVLFGVCLLALFFLFRHGGNLSEKCRNASQKLFGERGERIGLQMVASVHGTVAGLVLVAMGEGMVMGLVFFLTGVPHPILFGLATAIAAMIPFAAAFAIGLAALILLGNSGAGAAATVAISGFAVVFVADHFVRPKVIGGATRLPFLWVLLGILGGVESFQLLGLFLGPAVMAALIMLWRELAGGEADARNF